MVIRVMLPGRTALEGKFSPGERVAAIFNFVRGCLRDPEMKFKLFTTPPPTYASEDDVRLLWDVWQSAFIRLNLAWVDTLGSTGIGMDGSAHDIAQIIPALLVDAVPINDAAPREPKIVPVLHPGAEERAAAAAASQVLGGVGGALPSGGGGAGAGAAGGGGARSSNQSALLKKFLGK